MDILNPQTADNVIPLPGVDMEAGKERRAMAREDGSRAPCPCKDRKMKAAAAAVVALAGFGLGRYTARRRRPFGWR